MTIGVPKEVKDHETRVGLDGLGVGTIIQRVEVMTDDDRTARSELGIPMVLGEERELAVEIAVAGRSLRERIHPVDDGGGQLDPEVEPVAGQGLRGPAWVDLRKDTALRRRARVMAGHP